jgi:hypothetical protein
VQLYERSLPAVHARVRWRRVRDRHRRGRRHSRSHHQRDGLLRVPAPRMRRAHLLPARHHPGPQHPHAQRAPDVCRPYHGGGGGRLLPAEPRLGEFRPCRLQVRQRGHVLRQGGRALRGADRRLHRRVLRPLECDRLLRGHQRQLAGDSRRGRALVAQHGECHVVRAQGADHGQRLR